MRQILGCAWCRAGSLAHSFARVAGTSALCQALFKAQSRTDKVPALSELPFHWGKKKNEQGNRESFELLINAVEENIAG